MALVVVVQSAEEVPALVGWAWQIALARREGLCVLRASPGADTEPVELDDAALADARDPVLAAIARATVDARTLAAGPETSSVVVRAVTASDLLTAIAAEVDRLEPSLLMIGGRWSAGGRGRPLVRRALDRLSCTVMAVIGHADAPPRRYLVPTAGGPHATAALRLVDTTARHHSGAVCALYVEAPDMEHGEAVARTILDRAIKEAGVTTGAHLDTRVVFDRTTRGGIQQVAGDYDAVMLGASNQGVIYRLLFGSVPETIAAEAEGPLIAVVRAAMPWSTRVRFAIERVLSVWIPQMSREDRISLYERLQTGSRWGFDFMALIGLSTSIAALGLVQSSTAVVIGAMLVAPLMTPLLGAGLALVQGNQVLLKHATRAVVFGFLLALGIGALVGFLSPIKVLTAEMAARGGPTLFDLGIALLSGVAAAFASARPHLLAALPGVAIAAALVPPIATVGLSLAFGELEVARGAALLFGTNVVAIVLGAALALWAAGVRGRGARLWARRTLAVLILALFGLTVPLGAYLLDLSGTRPSNVTEEVRQVAQQNGYRFLYLERRNQALEVHLQGPDLPDPVFVQQLREVAWERFGEPVPVRVITQLAIEAR